MVNKDAYNIITEFLDKTRKPVTENTFKNKLIKAYGLEGNRQVEDAYRIAFTLSGKQNFYEILNVFQLLQPLICERTNNGKKCDPLCETPTTKSNSTP